MVSLFSNLAFQRNFNLHKSSQVNIYPQQIFSESAGQSRNTTTVGLPHQPEPPTRSDAFSNLLRASLRLGGPSKLVRSPLVGDLLGSESGLGSAFTQLAATGT